MPHEHDIPLLPTDADQQRQATSLVSSVLRCAGEAGVSSIPTDPLTPEDQLTLVTLDHVNTIIQELFDQAGQRYGNRTWTPYLLIGTRTYTIPSALMTLRSDPFIAERDLAPWSIDELDTEDPNGDDEGPPEHYSEDSGLLYVHPTPDSAWMTDKMCSQGGTDYRCILRHTASTADANGPHQANGATYWEAAPAGQTAPEAWTEGRIYYPPTLTARYIGGPTLLTNSSDEPSLPTWFYPAIIAGACWLLKDHLEFDRGQVNEARNLYDRLKAARIAGRSLRKQNPRSRMRKEDRL